MNIYSLRKKSSNLIVRLGAYIYQATEMLWNLKMGIFHSSPRPGYVFTQTSWGNGIQDSKRLCSHYVTFHSARLDYIIYVRVRGVTWPKIYELTPPHGTPLTPRPQELTPCANHHGTPALTDRFLDWFVIFLRDLVHFTSVREFFDLTPNVKERMAHLQDVFYQPKFSDVIPIVGTTYLISKNVIHDGFPHWHTEYIQVLR